MFPRTMLDEYSRSNDICRTDIGVEYGFGYDSDEISRAAGQDSLCAARLSLPVGWDRCLIFHMYMVRPAVQIVRLIRSFRIVTFRLLPLRSAERLRFGKPV